MKPLAGPRADWTRIAMVGEKLPRPFQAMKENRSSSFRGLLAYTVE